jgi:phospho-N-acetylmuramoyl-pentapeptide-transferase
VINVVLSGAIAALFSLFGTPVLIRFLRKHGYSQAIRESADGIVYPDHEGKRGTPSMGGLAIVGGVILGYFGAHLIRWSPPSASGFLAVYLMVGLSFVGMADDYLKIFKQRSTGVRARTKLLGQAGAALSFAALSVKFPNANGVTPASMAISIVRDLPIILPMVVFLFWIWFLITGVTNGVNLTDGLDGLAAGAAGLTFLGFTLISIWQFGQNCLLTVSEPCYAVRDPLDLAAFASACAGATFGFMWWNTNPAQIFMGDTGSLALGGAISALAIMARTELLVVLLGGLFVIVTLSVIIQVGSFKLTGKRPLRMAPLHHHFEMLGWQEITIVVRFWLIQGLCIAAGLSIFYTEWVKS